ncbi:Beta-carotene isomerase D27, chloroplastic [Apostasia shenzhenica]|uniref:Beta-carotene isomerase D27, chloroplastic n=1 Tax=Apostasia shenzhenica TaxID=1088818 RepID=A0A2H9ZZU9_9ASPA|nr:Beta-carotene isomerase D27, chloroplastic [Apostasia shenzhenica]
MQASRLLHHREASTPLLPRRLPAPDPSKLRWSIPSVISRHRRSPLTTAALTTPTIPHTLRPSRSPKPCNPRLPLEETAKKTVFDDNWFHLMAIQHLSNSIQIITGVKSREKGYEGLVEAAGVVARRHGSDEQQEIVGEALRAAFPAPVMAMLKSILPQSKISREFFAKFTTICFSWLVGPCQVKESDFQGEKNEKNVVYIPKCRFLEATNCVGMCTNLCKVPSQNFINSSLGMPTNMVPNFEEKSCEIIFGQHPPADDPALKQPCYRTQCMAKIIHGAGCSS